MNTMKTIEKIRQKIEELYDGEAPAHAQQCDFDDGYFTGIGAISKFLSTLESEKPMNQDELEEEISRTYHDGSVTDTSDLDHNSYENIARHFAQWGAEHFRDSTTMDGHSEKPNTHLEHVPEIKETGTQGLDEAAKNYALNTAEDSEQYSARYLGYKDGAKWQKEQDDKELSEKIAGAYQLGLADKEKQMMKEAVEGEVVKTDKHTSVRYKSFYGTDRYFYGIADKQFKPGDKVRVIVCKKED